MINEINRLTGPAWRVGRARGRGIHPSGRWRPDCSSYYCCMKRLNFSTWHIFFVLLCLPNVLSCKDTSRRSVRELRSRTPYKRTRLQMSSLLCSTWNGGDPAGRRRPTWLKEEILPSLTEATYLAGRRRPTWLDGEDLPGLTEETYLAGRRRTPLVELTWMVDERESSQTSKSVPLAIACALYAVSVFGACAVVPINIKNL